MMNTLIYGKSQEWKELWLLGVLRTDLIKEYIEYFFLLSLVYPNWLYFCVVLILIAIVIAKFYSQLTPSPFWHLSSELHKKKNTYTYICIIQVFVSFTLRLVSLYALHRYASRFPWQILWQQQSLYTILYIHLCRVSFSFVEFIFASAIWNHLLN